MSRIFKFIKNLLKNLLALPITLVIFILLFIISDTVLGAIYTPVYSMRLPYLSIAIPPTAILWFALQFLANIFILLRLISNGIYYLISQFVIVAYMVFVKYSSYLWFLNEYKDTVVSIKMQRSIFTAELILAGIACAIIICIWKRFYK